MDDTLEARARRRRATWQGTKGTTQVAHPHGLGTLEERIAAVRVVSEAAWLLAGRSMPQYDRATMPGRVVRRG